MCSIAKGQVVAAGQDPAKLELVQMASAFANGGDICDAQEFKDPEGTTTILATIDYSGRKFCNELIRIKRGQPPVLLQRMGIADGDSVSDLLKDVDGDGHDEIVFPYALTPYRGARCAAWIPAIYVCSATNCVDRTKDFPGFLRQKLGEFDGKLSQEMGGRKDPDRIACFTISRDKLRRMVGGEPTAGLDAAEAWLNDQDPARREDAALVLRDIDSDDARRILDSLVDDHDKKVARIARQAQLERTKERPK